MVTDGHPKCVRNPSAQYRVGQLREDPLEERYLIFGELIWERSKVTIREFSTRDEGTRCIFGAEAHEENFRQQSPSLLVGCVSSRTLSERSGIVIPVGLAGSHC